MVLPIEKGKVGLRVGPGRGGVNRRKRRKKMLPRKGGRKGGHDRGYHAAPPPPEIHAHAQRQSGLREKDKNKETGNRGTGYCFRCGQPGHHSRECPCLQEKKKDKSRSRDRDRDRDKDKEKKDEDRDRSRDRGKEKVKDKDKERKERQKDDKKERQKDDKKEKQKDNEKEKMAFTVNAAVSQRILKRKLRAAVRGSAGQVKKPDEVSACGTCTYRRKRTTAQAERYAARRRETLMQAPLPVKIAAFDLSELEKKNVKKKAQIFEEGKKTQVFGEDDEGELEEVVDEVSSQESVLESPSRSTTSGPWRSSRKTEEVVRVRSQLRKPVREVKQIIQAKRRPRKPVTTQEVKLVPARVELDQSSREAVQEKVCQIRLRSVATIRQSRQSWRQVQAVGQREQLPESVEESDVEEASEKKDAGWGPAVMPQWTRGSLGRKRSK